MSLAALRAALLLSSIQSARKCLLSCHCAQGPILGVSFRKCPQMGAARFQSLQGGFSGRVVRPLPCLSFCSGPGGRSLKDLPRFCVFVGGVFALA